MVPSDLKVPEQEGGPRYYNEEMMFEKKRASTSTEDVNSESNVKVAQVSSPKLRNGAKMEIRMKVNIGTEAGSVSEKSFLN